MEITIAKTVNVSSFIAKGEKYVPSKPVGSSQLIEPSHSDTMPILVVNGTLFTDKTDLNIILKGKRFIIVED